jgi:hypothetical protein
MAHHGIERFHGIEADFHGLAILSNF